MIPVRILGDRVLVKPDVDPNAPEMTASGVVLAKSLAAAVTGEDATVSVHRGTVIAVGNPRHPLWQEAEDLAQLVRVRHSHGAHMQGGECDYCDAAQMLCDLVRRRPAVLVGDDVLFSHDAGQQITLENETYIILREHELLAIVEPESEAA